MELFRKLRLAAGRNILRNKAKRLRRRKSFCNINNAKKIGIVWDATSSADFAVISDFQLKMADRNIGVEILGYFPGKVLPDRYTAVRYLTCLKRTDLNFFYIPDKMETISFTNKPFNILIDLNRNSFFPLTYISTLSQAEFKVGVYNRAEDTEIFDLMIETEDSKDLTFRLEQAVHYLEMINKG